MEQPRGLAQSFPPWPIFKMVSLLRIMGHPRPFTSNHPPYQYPMGMGQGVPGQMMQGGGHTFKEKEWNLVAVCLRLGMHIILAFMMRLYLLLRLNPKVMIMHWL